MDSVPGISSRNTNQSIPVKVRKVIWLKGELVRKNITSPKFHYTEILCDTNGNENGELIE
jgi:hypothetical protein